jgi:mannose-6-phosphate isomerase-like protein (cupin superfamily)
VPVKPKAKARTAGKGLRPIRRIVTGHDARGRSIIVEDKASPHVLPLYGVPNFGVTDLWKTYETPADNAAKGDACKGPITLAPPANGTVFRMVEFPPDREYMDKADHAKMFASMGKSGAEALDGRSERHAHMHVTQSVDYAFVMSGEIWAVLDRHETKMKAGDVLVQRGTNHAWSNRSRKPAIVGFVLVSAKPL